MTIGERIKAARKKAGMTQKQLAEKLNISYVNISQLENNQRTPGYETIRRIADALGVSIYELFDGSTVDEAGTVHVWPAQSETGAQIPGGDEFDYLLARWRFAEKNAVSDRGKGIVVDMGSSTLDLDTTSQHHMAAQELDALLAKLQDGEPLVLSPEELAKLKSTPKEQIAAALDKEKLQDTDFFSLACMIESLGTPQARIAAALDKLNEEGQEKVASYAEDLVEMPKYQAQEPPTAPAQDTPPAPEGTDTTPAEAPPGGPQDRITAITMVCPICGMTLRGDPVTGKAHCHYCNRSFPLPKRRGHQGDKASFTL